MPTSIPADPILNETMRAQLLAATDQARGAFTRLQSEYERLVEDPDVIQEDRSTAQVLAEQARRALEQAAHALGRFDAGTYGICTECGVVINEARLQAVPDAETCRDCS